jgi:hypothetical protein
MKPTPTKPVPACIRCDGEAGAERAVARGAKRRWGLCEACRQEWSKLAEVGRLDEPTRFERDESLRFLFRVADGLGVDPFDAIARECLRHQALAGKLDEGGLDLLTEDARLLYRHFGMGYSYTPGARPKILRTIERAEREERKRRAQANLPPLPFPGEAAKQRQVKYRLRAKRKPSRNES